MQDNTEKIETNGEYIEDYEISPFESVYFILHNRSQLEKEFHKLSYEERIKLLIFDLRLIQNAKKMAEHIGEIYDFRISEEPQHHWWWYLDRVARGELSFRLHADIQSEIE